MGNALMQAWLDSKRYSISIVDPKVAKNIKTNNRKKLKLYVSHLDIKDFSKFDFIIFAIKPSELGSVLKNFKDIKFKKNAILISVIAGKKIKIFKKN